MCVRVLKEPLWHHRRKILNQAFTPKLLELYSATIHQRAHKFVKNLHAEGDVIVMNISEKFLKFALSAVCGEYYYLNSMIEAIRQYMVIFTNIIIYFFRINHGLRS